MRELPFMLEAEVAELCQIVDRLEVAVLQEVLLLHPERLQIVEA